MRNEGEVSSLKAITLFTDGSCLGMHPAIRKARARFSRWESDRNPRWVDASWVNAGDQAFSIQAAVLTVGDYAATWPAQVQDRDEREQP
jgi:hypothetical protein